MKVTATPKEHDSSLPFPKLMVSKLGKVVLFREPNCGVNVVQGAPDGYQIGDYHEAWLMADFQDFHGTITIEQE